MNKSIIYLENLYDTIVKKSVDGDAQSYTKSLFESGINKIAQKVGEEGVEVALAGVVGSDLELRGELADLFYHSLVLMARRNITIDEVMDVLISRSK